MNCPTCNRESDRLAPLLTSRLVDVNVLLGLDPYALHEERLEMLRKLQILRAAIANTQNAHEERRLEAASR